MNYRLSYSIIILGFLLWAGCTTSSKVDDFLETAEKEKIITTSVSSGLVSDNQSDELLLGSDENQDTTDGVRWLYKDYSIELVNQAKANQKKLIIVVYDRADDNTVKLDKAINTSLGRIPSDVMILKIDYNQAKEIYQANNANTVIYMDVTGKIINTSDWGIYTMDSLLYYL